LSASTTFFFARNAKSLTRKVQQLGLKDFLGAHADKNQTRINPSGSHTKFKAPQANKKALRAEKISLRAKPFT
jgi:hypothetical protein